MTKNMTCLILEDDHFTMRMIREILGETYPHIRVIACTQIAEAEIYIRSSPVDFCILDINLPDGNSLDWLVKTFRAISYPFRIIFITAYSSYAVKAFQFNALDFLLKPFSPADLKLAVDKVLQSIDDEHRRIELEQAFYNLSQNKLTEQKLVLRTQEDIYIIRLKEIIYLSSDNNYCHFHLTDGRTILISKPLKYYSDKLNGFGFVRIHQSHLVHGIHIVAFKKKSDQLIVSNHDMLPVAQSRRGELVAFLGQL